jgi:hypothetical protein
MEFPHLIDTSQGPTRRPRAPPGASDGGCGPGLVTSHTSGTSEGLVELDPFLTRLRRLRRSVLTAARMHEFELRHKAFKPAMLTLTYRQVGDWQPHHISELLQRIRNWLRAAAIACATSGSQSSSNAGALHYHVSSGCPAASLFRSPTNKDGGPMDQPESSGPASLSATSPSTPASSTQGRHRLPQRSPTARPRRPRRTRAMRWLPGSTCPNGPERSVTWLVEQCASKVSAWLTRETGVCLPSPWRVSCARVALICRRRFCYGEPAGVAGPSHGSTCSEPCRTLDLAQAAQLLKVHPRLCRSWLDWSACLPARSAAPGSSSSTCSSTT